jgi:hypothetical protein
MDVLKIYFYQTETPMQLQMELPTLDKPKPKQKRNKKSNYDTTYCFSLSTSLYESLVERAKFERKSISKFIRESIVSQINSGRV